MIDLHIKTSLSTGQIGTLKLLETVDEADIKYFSITDKNHAFAYNLIDLKAYPNLITGTSINTYFNGRPIDLICYDIDTKIVNKWYDERYSVEKIEWIEHDRKDQIVEMLKSKSFEINEDYPRYNKLGISIKQIFADLIEKYPEFIYKNERDFRLYGLNNPDSEYYIDQTVYLPELEEVITLINKAGGKMFLSHPFEYRTDVGELLQMVLDKNLDGVEVYHASISVLDSLKLIDFCEATNKLASIGSGFIGNEELIPLGVHLDEEVLNKECFDWIFNR